jgi:hypothetical protein
MVSPPDPPPAEPRLTEAQRRHLAITLGLLQQQLREVETMLALPAPQEGLATEAEDLPSSFGHEATGIIARINHRVAALAGRFDLPRREGSRFRWVRSVLGILDNDLEDARAEKMGGYGAVDPALAAVLDPGIGQLQQDVRALQGLLEPSGETTL